MIPLNRDQHAHSGVLIMLWIDLGWSSRTVAATAPACKGLRRVPPATIRGGSVLRRGVDRGPFEPSCPVPGVAQPERGCAVTGGPCLQQPLLGLHVVRGSPANCRARPGRCLHPVWGSAPRMGVCTLCGAVRDLGRRSLHPLWGFAPCTGAEGSDSGGAATTGGANPHAGCALPVRIPAVQPPPGVQTPATGAEVDTVPPYRPATAGPDSGSAAPPKLRPPAPPVPDPGRPSPAAGARRRPGHRAGRPARLPRRTG